MTEATKREIYFSFFMFTADLRPDDADYTRILIDHLRALTEMGYDGFDVHIAAPSGPVDPRADVQGYVRLKKAFDEAGFKDAAFTTNVGTTRTFDPTSPYAEQRKQALSYLKSRVDITAVLGGESIMSGPFLYPYGVFPTTDGGDQLWSDALLDWLQPRYDAARPIFDELTDYATSKGVKLAIEPVKSWETPGPNSVSQALDFIDTLDANSPCGVTIDTAQIVMESEGPNVFRDNVARSSRKKRLYYVHFSSPDRGAMRDSWIPWNVVLSEIEPVYDGPYLVEVFNAIPPFASSMRMARRRFWRPGEDAREDLPSAYDVAREALHELRKQIAASAALRSEA